MAAGDRGLRRSETVNRVKKPIWVIEAVKLRILKSSPLATSSVSLGFLRGDEESRPQDACEP